MEIDNLQEARYIFNSKQLKKLDNLLGKKQLFMMSLHGKKKKACKIKFSL